MNPRPLDGITVVSLEHAIASPFCTRQLADLGALAALSPEHPCLIVCDISGYGGDGPYHDKKAYDLLIQSNARHDLSRY